MASVLLLPQTLGGNVIRKPFSASWRIAAFIAALLLYPFLGPRAEAAWEKLNHGDPVLETLAALLIVIVLALFWLAIHMLWPSRKRP